MFEEGYCCCETGDSGTADGDVEGWGGHVGFVWDILRGGLLQGGNKEVFWDYRVI